MPTGCHDLEPAASDGRLPDIVWEVDATNGAAQGADLGRAGLVLEILAKLVDELAGREQLVD